MPLPTVPRFLVYVGAVILSGYAVLHQGKLVKEVKQQGESLCTGAGGSGDGEESFLSGEKSAGPKHLSSPFVDDISQKSPMTAAERKVQMQVEESSTSSASVTPETPLFVLSLPFHYDLAIPRYFECGGYDTARHWTHEPNKPSRDLIGFCMLQNIQESKPILQDCVASATTTGGPSVYMDLQALAPPHLRKQPNIPSKCFDPVLYPGALEKLYQQYPTATILNVVTDPIQWVQSLSQPYPHFWNEFCNDSHNNSFPTSADIGNPRSMVGFYTEYQQAIKKFTQSHTGWNYVEIDLQEDAQVTANHLQKSLNINAQCWMDSTHGNILHEHDPKIPSLLKQQPRPNDVGWPMMVVSMAKAGTNTVHNYFSCGLESWASAHKWTIPNKGPNTGYVVEVGRCMLNNTIDDVHPFLDGCGNNLIWTDIGIHRRAVKNQKEYCYFPQLHRDGLERFYQSYPYGTLLNMVRNTESWVDSALRWNNLLKRYNLAGCEGMPNGEGRNITVGEIKQEWADWYDSVHNRFRQFAKDHPTLTYIELPLNDRAADMLHDVFRFPKTCWGQANVNTKNQ